MSFPVTSAQCGDVQSSALLNWLICMFFSLCPQHTTPNCLNSYLETTAYLLQYSYS